MALEEETFTIKAGDWSELHLRLQQLEREYYVFMINKDYVSASAAMVNINVTAAALLFMHTSGRIPSGTNTNNHS